MAAKRDGLYFSPGSVNSPSCGTFNAASMMVANGYATSEFSHADVGLFYLNGSVNKFGNLVRTTVQGVETVILSGTVSEDGAHGNYESAMSDCACTWTAKLAQ
jgi:hypothetical protein